MNPARQGRAIGYVRVSTGRQAESGAGLAAQENAIRTECERRGWTLLRIASDPGASGASMRHRPGLLEALEDLDAGSADTLVVAKLDRLSRSLVDLSSLMERARGRGWGLAILDTDVDTTTASGELVANVMGSVAQWERRIIGERTTDALAAKKAQGVKLGRPRTVPEDVRARIVSERDAGATWQAVADALNDDGVPLGQGGRRWYPNTVRRLYLSETREG
jgi:DNA invertase Pin-like site-specific DNA recombinase